jgi:hypothetical protein
MSSRFIVSLIAVATTIGLAIGVLRVSSAEDPGHQSVLAVKVAVQLLEDNLVEFGIEHDGERTLPDFNRINLSYTQRKRWVTSSPVTIEAPDREAVSGDAWATRGFGTVPVELRVAAWIEADHSIWFAIVHDGEHLRPERRRIPRQAIDDPENHNRWLTSSPVEIEVGETPASLLRTFSAEVTVLAGMVHSHEDQTLVDIAQTCSLDSVSPFDGDPDPEPVWSRWTQGDVAPDGYPAFRWKVTNSDFAHSSSTDAVWLWRNVQLSSYWAGRPAPEYLFIVRDVRPGYGATMWAAVFDCSTVDVSDRSDIDINTELDPV